MTKKPKTDPDWFLASLEEQHTRLADAARLLGIPERSPYREREYELQMRIREHKEIMRS